MLSKAVIFCFTFLGFFGLLMATMPLDFIPVTYSATYMEKEVAAVFDAADIVMYNNSVAIILNYTDGPYSTGFGLPSGQYLEIDWTIRYSQSYIYFRHLVSGILGYWYDYHNLNVYANSVLLPYSDKIFKADMVNNYDATKNATIFSLKDPLGHITSNVIFKPFNTSLTMAQNWDAGHFHIFLSYNVDYDVTGFSAWSLLAQLLTFQAPTLGIGGVGGIILEAITAIPTYACIVYLVYKGIAGLIPLVSGGSGD